MNKLVKSAVSLGVGAGVYYGSYTFLGAITNSEHFDYPNTVVRACAPHLGHQVVKTMVLPAGCTDAKELFETTRTEVTTTIPQKNRDPKVTTTTAVEYTLPPSDQFLEDHLIPADELADEHRRWEYLLEGGAGMMSLLGGITVYRTISQHESRVRSEAYAR